jgi:putative transposase
LVGISRSSARYTPRPQDDASLAERLKELSRQRKRYGYRRAWVTLRREGKRINHKRVYRVWRAEGLSRKRPTRKRRGRPVQSVPCTATHPDHVWTYDFIHDACLQGRALKLLTVVDEFTRECVWIEVGRSIRAEKVQQVLEELFAQRGAPQFLRSDNGPEFVARRLRAWLSHTGAQTLYIEPGRPWQNAYGESFHSRLRDECLNLEVFAGRPEAQVVLELWRRDYNEQRPHSSLGYLTPVEFRAQWEADHGHGERPGLPPSGLPEGDRTKGQSIALPPSVQPPAAALGLLPSRALSSGRAESSVT